LIFGTGYINITEVENITAAIRSAWGMAQARIVIIFQHVSSLFIHSVHPIYSIHAIHPSHFHTLLIVSSSLAVSPLASPAQTTTAVASQMRDQDGLQEATNAPWVV